MAKPRGLGRGLDALLGDDTAAVGEGSLVHAEIGQITPGRFQPRSEIDPSTLTELADSIRAQGVLQPILVRQAEQGYELIAGERRWRAAQMAGLEQIPVIVRDVPDDKALAVALIENIQRENLNPIEEARGILRLIEEFSLTHEMVASAIGRSRSAVTNLLRLLKLPAEVQELLEHNQLDMGHARALLALPEEQRIAVAEQAAREGLTVRDMERLAAKPPAPDPLPPAEKLPAAAATAVDPDTRRLEEHLAERLGTPVEIVHRKNGAGRLVIRYGNLDQLDIILSRLNLFP